MSQPIVNHITLDARLVDALSRTIPLLSADLGRYTKDESERAGRRLMLNRLARNNDIGTTLTFTDDQESVATGMFAELADTLEQENAVARDIAPSIVVLAAFGLSKLTPNDSWMYGLIERPFENDPRVTLRLPHDDLDFVHLLVSHMTQNDGLLDRSGLSRRKTNRIRRDTFVALETSFSRHTHDELRFPEASLAELVALLDAAIRLANESVRFEIYRDDRLPGLHRRCQDALDASYQTTYQQEV